MADKTSVLTIDRDGAKFLKDLIQEWMQKPKDKGQDNKFELACELYLRFGKLNFEDEEMDPTAGSYGLEVFEYEKMATTVPIYSPQQFVQGAYVPEYKNPELPTIGDLFPNLKTKEK